MYSHEGLTLREKARARIRAIRLVVAHALEIGDREDVTAREAVRLAAEQHNRKVRQMRHSDRPPGQDSRA